MKAVILDPLDHMLASEDLPDGDFAFQGNGALIITILYPGAPKWLLLTENDGRVIGRGRFHKDIKLDKVWHKTGDQITVKLHLG